MSNMDEMAHRIKSMSPHEKLELGQAIGRLREFLGKSQRDIYEHADLSIPKSTYANIERTGGAQPSQVIKALELLGTDVDRILAWYRGAREALDDALGKEA